MGRPSPWRRPPGNARRATRPAHPLGRGRRAALPRRRDGAVAHCLLGSCWILGAGGALGGRRGAWWQRLALLAQGSTGGLWCACAAAHARSGVPTVLVGCELRSRPSEQAAVPAMPASCRRRLRPRRFLLLRHEHSAFYRVDVADDDKPAGSLGSPGEAPASIRRRSLAFLSPAVMVVLKAQRLITLGQPPCNVWFHNGGGSSVSGRIWQLTGSIPPGAAGLSAPAEHAQRRPRCFHSRVLG